MIQSKIRTTRDRKLTTKKEFDRNKPLRCRVKSVVCGFQSHAGMSFLAKSVGVNFDCENPSVKDT